MHHLPTSRRPRCTHLAAALVQDQVVSEVVSVWLMLKLLLVVVVVVTVAVVVVVVWVGK